jgi:hypothetical protein
MPYVRRSSPAGNAATKESPERTHRGSSIRRGSPLKTSPSRTPARAMASAHSNAEPSRIGSSGPATSMRASSTPNPASAARRCSVVCTLAAPDASSVESCDGRTACSRASIPGCPSISIRKKAPPRPSLGRQHPHIDPTARVQPDAAQAEPLAQRAPPAPASRDRRFESLPALLLRALRPPPRAGDSAAALRAKLQKNTHLRPGRSPRGEPARRGAASSRRTAFCRPP